MLVLALETATRAGSLALFADRAAGPAMAGDAARTHGIRLPAEIIGFLARAGLTLDGVDRFAVVTGPGSFTGLRIGLATIQGLALPRHRPVIGVPTLEAMASGWLDAQATADIITVVETLLVTTLDGARGDVFYAVYDVTGAAAIEHARVLIEPAVAEPVVAAQAIAEIRRGRAMILTGDLPDPHRRVFEQALGGIRTDEMPNLAAAAAALAARRDAESTAPHALRPIYVRRPDAELARERAAGQRAAAGPPVTITVVTDPADVAAVARLQARAFSDAWGAEAFGGAASTNVARLYAARDVTGSFVAYCAGWRVVDELHINSLAVEPARRRQGIAKMLLRHVMAAEARAGATGATLEVRESNRAGRALYESLGFRVEGVRRGYYQNPREDALVLWHRHLGSVA